MDVNYELKRAVNDDIPALIEYKLSTVLEYSDNLSEDEINRIDSYVRDHVPRQLDEYKVVCICDKKIGCLLVEEIDDGVLIDELYLENEYRNKGIGTDIIKKIISEGKAVYLWVYKRNVKAINLYERLGFVVSKETEERLYMKCPNR